MSPLRIAILGLLATLLFSSDAMAKRILVGPNMGGSLLQSCLLEDDAREVQTTNGNYVGCCSKKLGYCVLCKKSGGGNCYKFTSMLSLHRFQQQQAPGGSTFKNEPQKPVKPGTGVGPAPGGGQISR